MQGNHLRSCFSRESRHPCVSPPVPTSLRVYGVYNRVYQIRIQTERLLLQTTRKKYIGRKRKRQLKRRGGEEERGRGGRRGGEARRRGAEEQRRRGGEEDLHDNVVGFSPAIITTMFHKKKSRFFIST